MERYAEDARPRTRTGTDSHLRKTGMRTRAAERAYSRCHYPTKCQLPVTTISSRMDHHYHQPARPRAQDVNGVTAEDKTTGPSGFMRNRIVVCAPFNVPSE